MQKIFILVLLCSALCLSHSFEATSGHNKLAANTLRRLDEYATTSGQIPLILGDLGFFVHVDFSDYKSLTTKPADSTTDYGNMVIALYTDQTFFGNSCQGFLSYCNQSQHNQDICDNTIGDSTVSVFPYFTSSSAKIKPELYLDYNHWFFQPDTIAYKSTGCDGDYSLGVYGLIGMGVTEDSKSNFNGMNPNFAIYIAKNLSNGSFAFNTDLTKAKSQTPEATLTTDNNWKIPKVDTVEMKKGTFDANAALIFDLGSDSVGLPKRIYDQVLNSLESHPSIGKCSVGDDFRPTCEFTGDIRHLPSIKFHIGDQTLEIPPEVYVVQTQNSSFYYDPIMFKIKSLSNTPGEGMYVTEQYQDCIILGYPVMSYYYTVFQAGETGQGTISLYLNNDYKSASDMIWIFVIAGVLGLFLIGGTFFVFEKKYRKNKELMQPLMGSQEPVKYKAQGKRIQDEKV